jgi:2-polyprenyl-3-methyl-5-hydroxy-6-metoxy-1,4-benzoquinol methylase
MGYSNPENKPWAQKKIIELRPTTVLDVGAGQGTYLNLIREGLGAEVIVNAVEVWQPYIDQFDLLNRYDKLFAMDVRDMTNFKYDLVILGDILEHMSEIDAVTLWENISKQAKHAMISIPIIHYHQDAINGNPYEIHVEEDWTMERVLEKFKGITEYKKFEVTGTFIAEFNNDNS